MSRVIRISFEIKDIYNREDFRILYNRYMGETDNVELFIISEDTTAYINSVQAQLGIAEANVISCDDIDEKIEAIDDNNIDIHFDNLQSNIVDIEEDNTDVTCILVNQMTDYYGYDLSYVKEFERAIKEIIENT